MYVGRGAVAVMVSSEGRDPAPPQARNGTRWTASTPSAPPVREDQPTGRLWARRSPGVADADGSVGKDQGQPVVGLLGRRGCLEVADPVDLLLELVAPRRVERPERLVQRVETLVDFVDGAAEALPLLREVEQAAVDLVALTFQLEQLGRLTDDRQDAEQGERRAQDDLAAQRLLRDGGVLLVDERVDALVGDEEEQLVERALGVDVGAVGQLLDPVADIGEEQPSGGARG